jgi:hypothetical protein
LIAVDTNILVYAHRSDSPWHAAAATCLRDLAEGAGSWAIPWPCLHEFVAIVTHERIYSPATPLPQALEQTAAWLEAPGLILCNESPGYWSVFMQVAVRAKIAGPRIHDARIAALCIHHGVRELWTADRDFGRFADLKTRNPLAGR